MNRSIGREAHPGIARARVVAAVGRVAARAARECRHAARPRSPAVERCAGEHGRRASVRPTVLLPYTDDVVRIAGIDRNHRLDFRVDVQDSRRRHAIATGGEWRARGSLGQNGRTRGVERAHVDCVRAVTLGDVPCGDHLRLYRGVGRVTMVRIHPLIPQPIHGNRAGRAGSGRGVRQRDVERIRASRRRSRCSSDRSSWPAGRRRTPPAKPRRSASRRAAAECRSGRPD